MSESEPDFITLNFADELIDTVNLISARGKGILMADMSAHEIGRVLHSIRVENTEYNRQIFREILFATEGARNYLSAAILHDETLNMRSLSGNLFLDILRIGGVVPGIRMETGTVRIARTLTEELDGMTRRCQRYYKAGARCAQCRAVIKICRGEPSRAAVQENAESLARFAMICQRNGLVPILKLEILREGYTFDIQQCADATEIFSAALFKSLSDRRVLPEALLFMATMILPGSDGPDACPNHHLVVGYTLQALQRTVPVSVPAVFFDPLGQSKDDAILNLNLLNKMDAAKPWNMSFCFGREFQQCALVPWAGKDENIEETQKALVMLCQANSLAATGKWVKAP